MRDLIPQKFITNSVQENRTAHDRVRSDVQARSERRIRYVKKYSAVVQHFRQEIIRGAVCRWTIYDDRGVIQAVVVQITEHRVLKLRLDRSTDRHPMP